MLNSPDSDHLHVADAVGFKVPEKIVTQLGILGSGRFTGRAVRCSVGEHSDYVMIADDDCNGRNVNAEEFEAATVRAISAYFS